MLIGVIVAMEVELQPYLERFPSYRVDEVKNKKFYIVDSRENEIVFVLSGIGKVNAAYSTSLLCDRYSPDFIISTGVSGGLGKSQLMDFVVAMSVVQYDCDTTAFGDPLGLVSTINKIYFETDSGLSEQFAEILQAKKGIFACGDTFVSSEMQIKKIVNTFNAIACDMESGAIGQVAYLTKTPFVILRCISDGANENAQMDYKELVSFASKKLADAVMLMLETL